MEFITDVITITAATTAKTAKIEFHTLVLAISADFNILKQKDLNIFLFPNTKS